MLWCWEHFVPSGYRCINSGCFNSKHYFWIASYKKAFTIGEATKVFSYTESVIPIILAVIVLHYLEKFLKNGFQICWRLFWFLVFL